MHAMSIEKDKQLGKSTIGTFNYSPRNSPRNNLSRNVGSFPSFTRQQPLPGSKTSSKHKVLTKRGSFHQMVVDTGTTSARFVQKTANQVMDVTIDVANVTKDAAMQVGKNAHGAAKSAALQTAKIAVASGKTSKKLSVKAAKAAAKKAGKVKQKLEAVALNQTHEKPKILRPERIKALIQVFEQGNTALGIAPNEHKAKELRWLLGLIWEEDTACWIAGSTLRVHKSLDVAGNCYMCQTTLMFRHHCRRCGTLVCDSCSQERCRLKVFWDEDEDHTPCLRVVSTDDQLRAPKLYRTCDRCITDMLHQQKHGQGTNDLKKKMQEQTKTNKLVLNEVEQHHEWCTICGNELPLNDKWVHPIDDATANVSEPNYWRKKKKSSTKNVCVNCVLEKRHDKGYLQTYDVSLKEIHPQADVMDIQDAIERLFPFTVHDISISMDSTKNPKVDESGQMHSIITVNNADTRNKLIAMKQLEILIPCGLQKNALVRIWPRASTREQLKKLGEPLYSFFRKNKLGYTDMLFVRTNFDSYTFKYNTREKTFLMKDIVLSGRRPSADFPEGARLENGYCFISTATFVPKRDVTMNHSSMLTMARRKVNNHALQKHQDRLNRRDHRAHGRDFRCIGAPDCVPDIRKKQYCMTCGGVRFSRDDLLQTRLSTADAIIEAIRHDDVVRLRACVLLRGSKKRNPANHDSLKIDKNGGFFLDLESVKGPMGSTATHMCCEYRATECLNFMFRLQSNHHPDMFSWVDMNGATPLIVAARVGWSVRKMVRQGAAQTVMVADEFGRLPLHYAALRGDVVDLEEILRAGSKHYQLNKKDHQFQLALDLINTKTATGIEAHKYLSGEREKCANVEKKMAMEDGAE